MLIIYIPGEKKLSFWFRSSDDLKSTQSLCEKEEKGRKLFEQKLMQHYRKYRKK